MYHKSGIPLVCMNIQVDIQRVILGLRDKMVYIQILPRTLIQELTDIEFVLFHSSMLGTL